MHQAGEGFLVGLTGKRIQKFESGFLADIRKQVLDHRR